jgi:hypothetical protein
VSTAAAAVGWGGIRAWHTGEKRIALAWLLSACLTLPFAFALVFRNAGWFTQLSQGNPRFELLTGAPGWNPITNAQLWWAIALSIPAYFWLRRYTRASVFSLVLAVTGALLCLDTLLRMGLLEWIENDPGRFYFQLLPFALAFLVAGYVVERLGHPSDSRYLYPIALAFMLTAFTGIAAAHQPWADWLRSAAPWTRGQHEYLFLANAGVYYVLQLACERISTAHLRAVAQVLRFAIPGHVMTSLLLLGVAASDRWLGPPANVVNRGEARLFEFLLPVVAVAFVFASLSRQMKNYFVWGLGFLAIGLIRLEQDFFRGRASWPVALLALGLALMLTASRYPRILLWLRRQRRV